MTKYKIQKFPDSRIATIDVCEIGKRKHHMVGLIELDVTKSREKIRKYNKQHQHKISFTAWLIKTISLIIKKYEVSASFLKGKNKRIIFDDINVSVLIEKDSENDKVPIPLVIERASEISIGSISEQIIEARKKPLEENEIVLQKKAKRLEKIYYLLPGFIRKFIWTRILKHPKLAYKEMGNVAFTSLGMIGKISGWFIPTSIHPICFGVGSVIKKPAVINNKIEIREILNMTVLLDHDVMDGAPMVRFISELSKNIESGINL